MVTHTGILIALLSGIFAVLWFGWHKAGRSRKQMLLPALFWFYLLAGAGSTAAGHIRMLMEQQWIQRELELGLDGKRVTVEGTLWEVTTGESQDILLLKDCTVRHNDRTGSLKRLRIYIQSDSTLLKLGNRIQAAGTMSVTSRPGNPGEFNYQLYYRSLKLNYQMTGQEVQVITPIVSKYREGLRRIRDEAGLILQHTAGADAGFYQAMVLGDKSGLDETVQELYQRSGISHLFAISGLHMSLIGMGVYRLIRRSGAGFLLAGLAGAALIISYVAMIGTTASVLRAMIMLVSAFLAAYLGRTYDLLSALALAVMVILWDSPYQLCQAGFQLSAGAVLGVGLLVPQLEQLCPDGDQLFILLKTCRQGLIAGIAIQLVTLPALLYHFFQIPLYGIFLNPIVIPLMGVIVVSGLAGILLGKIAPAAGVFAVGAGHYILKYYEWICRCFAALPGSTLVWGRPKLWQILIYYCVLTASLWLAGRKQLKKMLLAAAASCLLLCPLPVSGLRVTFLDVGQGDGIVVQTRSHTIMIDGGSSSVKKLGKYRLEPFLKSCGITVIDYAYVTHGDSDHISGLVYLLEAGQDIRIRNLMLPVLGREDEAYQQLVSLVAGQGGAVHWIAAGDSIRNAILKLTCLYPGSADQAPDRNAHSSVIKLDYGDFHMLLTGDMGAEQELTMMSRPEIRVKLSEIQVLKLAHHGSRTSSSKDLLELLDPAWAVVSYGEDNSYGHPHEEVRERLEKLDIILFETARGGAVQLETDGTRIRWNYFASPVSEGWVDLKHLLP
ncbi:MAG: DNA internalization-related competence protein ComEC/Rec2 [Lachnospiraceae bacterium]